MRVGRIFLALTTALTVALASWLASNHALQLITTQLQQGSAGKLRIQGVRGNLFSDIEADSISYQTSALSVQLQRLKLNLNFWRLLRWQAAADQISAEYMQLNIKPSNKPAHLPMSLKPPIPVHLSNLSIQKLDIRTESFPLQLRRVKAALSADSRYWQLQQLEADSAIGHVTIVGTVASAAPFALKFQVDAQQTEWLAYKARFHLTGNLAAPLFRLAAKAGAAALRTEAILSPFATAGQPPFQRLIVQMQRFNPHALFGSGPIADLSLRLQATAQPDRRLQAHLAIQNRAPGTFSQNRLPLTTMDTRLAGFWQQLAIQNPTIDLGEAGKFSGEGFIRNRDFKLQLQTKDLNLHGLHPHWRKTKLSGQLVCDSQKTGQTLQFKLGEQQFKLELNSRFHNNILLIDRVYAHGKQGEFLFNAQVALNDKHPFSLKGTVHRFNPADFGNFPDLILNSRLALNGTLSPVAQIGGKFWLKNSRLFGLAANGQGLFRAKHFDSPDVSVNATGQLGVTRAQIKGTIQLKPKAPPTLDVNLVLSGKSLAELFPIIQVPLPPTPPYTLSGNLIQRPQRWEFRQFQGRVGSSDLRGKLTIDRHHQPQLMQGDLLSERLDLADLAGLIGGQAAATGASSPKVSQRVLPTEPYNTQKMRAANADIRFQGKHILTTRLPLTNMETRVLLKDGQLQLYPLDFGVAGGKLNARIRMDARHSKIATTADLRFQSLLLNKLFPGLDVTQRSLGQIDGRAAFTGHGNSIAAMLGTANGDLTLFNEGGTFSDVLLRLADLDLANTVKALVEGNKSVPLHCMIGKFDVRDGQVQTERLAIDTAHTFLAGSGIVDLKKEKLALKIVAKPAENSFFSLRGPIYIEGSFSEPNVHIERGHVLGRGGAAVVLSLINPLAALLPFMSKGTATHIDCPKALAAAKKSFHARWPSKVTAALTQR